MDHYTPHEKHNPKHDVRFRPINTGVNPVHDALVYPEEGDYSAQKWLIWSDVIDASTRTETRFGCSFWVGNRCATVILWPVSLQRSTRWPSQRILSCPF